MVRHPDLHPLNSHVGHRKADQFILSCTFSLSQQRSACLNLQTCQVSYPSKMSTATTLPSNINSPKTTKGAMRPAVTVQKDSSMIDETSHNRKGRDNKMPNLSTHELTCLGDIARELGKLEAMFHIDQQKLKQIVKRFEQELDEGMWVG